jgi:hypothetical protein
VLGIHPSQRQHGVAPHGLVQHGVNQVHADGSDMRRDERHIGTRPNAIQQESSS